VAEGFFPNDRIYYIKADDRDAQTFNLVNVCTNKQRLRSIEVIDETDNWFIISHMLYTQLLR